MQQTAYLIGCGHALLNLQRAGIALRLQMQQCMRLHMREMLEPTGLWQKEIEDRIVPLHHALQALVVRHLGLACPDDGIQRLVFAIMGIPVYLIMAQDLVQALSPNLLHRPDAIAAAVDAFSHYAQTLVEREREMRQQGRSP